MSKEILHLVLYGHPYTKKNAQRTIFHKYLKRNIVVYTANYTAWKNDCMKQLQYKPKLKLEIDYPIILKLHFYVKDARLRDISNFYEGIQDFLVEAGVLKDDNYKIISGHDGSRMFIDKEHPRIELWIIKE